MTLINSIEFGSITVDSKIYSHDVVVSWDGKIKEAKTFVRHVFGRDEFEELIKKNPEVIVVGTGDPGFLRVSGEIGMLCKQKNIELIEITSKRAIEKFNENIKKGKKVIAFIHVTC